MRLGRFPISPDKAFDRRGFTEQITPSLQGILPDPKCRQDAITSLRAESWRGLDSFDLTVDTRCRGLLSLPVSAIPGWRVGKNGVPSQSVRVGDSTLGVLVEAGITKIHVAYDPPYLGMHLMMSAICFCVIMGLCGLQFVRYCRSSLKPF